LGSLKLLSFTANILPGRSKSNSNEHAATVDSTAEQAGVSVLSVYQMLITPHSVSGRTPNAVGTRSPILAKILVFCISHGQRMWPWTAGLTSVHHTSWTSFRLRYVRETRAYILEWLDAERRQTARTACSFKTPVFKQQIARPNSPHKREMCSSMCVTEESTVSEFSPWNRLQSGFLADADTWSFQSCVTRCYAVGWEFQHGCASSPTARPSRWKHYGKYSSIDRALIFQQTWIFRTSKLTLTSVYQTTSHLIRQFLYLQFSLTLCSWYVIVKQSNKRVMWVGSQESIRDPSSRRRLQQHVDVAAWRKCRGSQGPAASGSHIVGSWYGGRRVGHVATCAARYKTQSGSGLKNQCTSGWRMRSVIVVIVAVAGAGMYSCGFVVASGWLMQC